MISQGRNRVPDANEDHDRCRRRRMAARSHLEWIRRRHRLQRGGGDDRVRARHCPCACRPAIPPAAGLVRSLLNRTPEASADADGGTASRACLRLSVERAKLKRAPYTSRRCQAKSSRRQVKDPRISCPGDSTSVQRRVPHASCLAFSCGPRFNSVVPACVARNVTS